MLRFLTLLLFCVLSLECAPTTWKEAVEFNQKLARELESKAHLSERPPFSKEESRQKYLSLLAQSVLALTVPNSEFSLVLSKDNKVLNAQELDEQKRIDGTDFPFAGLSASGRRNLDRLRSSLESTAHLEESVVSCAPFRGGTAVFMRGVLDSSGNFDKKLVVVGNFEESEPRPIENEFEDPSVKILKMDVDRIHTQGVPDDGDIPVLNYIKQRSRSSSEIHKNFVHHFTTAPDEGLVKFVRFEDCHKDNADCNQPVSLLHVGPASPEEVKQCILAFKDNLIEGAKVILDRCIADSNCKKTLEDTDFKLKNVVSLESGGIEGSNGDLPKKSKPHLAIYPDLTSSYLQLVERSVLGYALASSEFSYQWDSSGVPNVTTHPLNRLERYGAEDWPWLGLSMVGVGRINQLYELITYIVENKIEGDFVECGTWRGGSSIYARALLDALGQYHRRVWVFDSFQGLPQNRTSFDEIFWSKMSFLGVSTKQVWNNFHGHELDNEDTVILNKGYFVDTLPTAPVKKIAILRMDGDMYESTLDTLYNLYDKVSLGGFVISDDAPRIGPSDRAIHDFARVHGFKPDIQLVTTSTSGCHWQKKEQVQIKREPYIAFLKDQDHIEYQRSLSSSNSHSEL